MGLLKKVSINLKCDKIWLGSDNISFFKKLGFLFGKYWAIGFNKRNIDFLGTKFSYDNQFAPVILELYPKEIMDIDKTINLSKVKNVLDIGSNIGQWAFTIKSFFPQTKVYSFEPNKEAFNILELNRKKSRTNNWFTFPYAISNKMGLRKFYFSKSASAEGSFYVENMSQNYVRTDVQETKVKSLYLDSSNLKKLKIPNNFDLVKIDVEGAEMEVLKGLVNISFRYLEIEVVKSRKIGITIKQVEEYFDQKGMKVKLLYQDFFDNTSPAGNAIFEIIRQ